MKVEFTDQQLNNLIIFLNRVDYKGINEAQALMELMSAIEKSKEN